MSDTLKKLLLPRKLILYIICGALAASTLLYCYIAFMISTNKDMSFSALVQAFSDPAIMPLAIAAVVVLTASFFIQPFLFKVMRPKTTDAKQLLLYLKNQTDRYGRKVLSDAQAEIAATLSEEEMNVFASAGPWIASSIIGFALIESFTLFGFILALQTHNFIIVPPFGFVSLVCFYLRRPCLDAFLQISNFK